MSDKVEGKDLAASACAGLLAGILLASGIGATTSLTQCVWRRSRLLSIITRVTTGIRPEGGRSSLSVFTNNSIKGATLGSGLFLAAVAYNWIVEVFDSMNNK